MSATRDQSQKVAFVYSNLYQIYQKGKSAAQNADVAADAPKPADTPLGVSRVLKSEDLHQQAGKAAPKISSYNPAELIGKRIARPGSLPPAPKASAVAGGSAPKHAIVSLKDNLKALNELHSRLRFMLQELEDLVRE